MKRYHGSSNGVVTTTLVAIRQAVDSGQISAVRVEVQDGERLDHIAHRFYGDGQLWWIIAAASGVGWWLQVPPGTVITVPDKSIISRV